MRLASWVGLGGGVLLFATGCPTRPSAVRDAAVPRDAGARVPVDAALAPPDAARVIADDAASVDAAATPDAPAAASAALPHTSSLHASMLVTGRGAGAVIADVDGSCLFALDLTVPSIALEGRPACIALPDHAMPWRMTEDGAGRVHVVLRGTGQLATLEPGASSVTTREVCAEPRGVAWRASDDTVLVACAEGRLVSLPASGGPVTRRIDTDDDLRDVVVTAAGRVLVSRFRSAEVEEIADDGSVVARWVPPAHTTPDAVGAAPGTPIATITERQTLVPRVAWRMLAVGDEVWLLHQGHRVEGIPFVAAPPVGTPVTTPYYGTPLAAPTRLPSACGAIVQSVLTRLDLDTPGAVASSLVLPDPVLVDVVSRPAADALVFVGESSSPTQISLATARSDVDCTALSSLEVPVTTGPLDAIAFPETHTTPVALTRGPLRVEVVPRVGGGGEEWVILDPRRTERGRFLFNDVTPSGLACISCHPEGGDDGHVWTNLPRPGVRTQTVQGGVLATPPFHWEGDLGTFDDLVDEVWTLRMGGFAFVASDRATFATWLDAIPAPRAPAEAADSVARGRALFASTEVGCTDCHDGPRLTNGQSLDVGTGGRFQVPSLLGIAYRAPYMHTGCAATLRDRFVGDASCTGGELHGHVAALSPDQVDDLVHYLRTL